MTQHARIHAYNWEEPIQTVPRPTRATRRKKRTKSRARSIFLIATAFIVCLVICHRYVTLSEQVNEIARKEAELSRLEGLNVQLAIELEQSIDLKKIEDYAVANLGMTKPQRYQIVYVTPQGVDKMEKVAQESPRRSMSLFGVFGNVLSYLH